MSSNTVGEELKSALLELEKTLEEESNLSAEHYSKSQDAHTRFFNSLKIWVSEIERQNPFVSYSTMGIAVKDASNRCETSLPIMTTKTTLWFGGNSSSTYLQFVPESFQEIRLDWVSRVIGRVVFKNHAPYFEDEISGALEEWDQAIFERAIVKAIKAAN